MTFLALPRLVPLILGCSITAACSSKPPPPDAFVDAVLGTSNSGNCEFSAQTALLIGTGTAAEVVTRKPASGDETLQCSVVPGGSGFVIDLNAAIDTSQIGQGGSLTITGTVSSDTDASPAGSNLSVSLTYAGNGYSASNCTLTYVGATGSSPFTNTNGVPPAPPPVAAGRIWGHVDCPAASNSNMTSTCDLSVDLVFENCGS